MREKILAVMEKNSRIDIRDLAILLGESEIAVANEIAEMEKEHIICGYHTLINWENTSEEKVIALIEVKVTPQRGMGFDKIADLFAGVAAVEKEHEERYRKLIANIENGVVFSREGDTIWQCRNCGHICVGRKAPEVCPVCAHPQSYFQVKPENY